MSDTRAVFLGVPTYDGRLHGASAMAAFLWPTRQPTKIVATTATNSLLAFGFNKLWCQALNMRAEQGLTHFAMLHADVVPEHFWLDTLLAELDATGASVVSAVVPIKSDHGLTSTAIQVGDGPHDPPRRFTLTETQSFPETFEADDIGFAGQPLLVNTGCWVCDFTQPWVEDFCFTVDDSIGRGVDGQFVPRVSPEDWHFSRWCHKRGIRVAATRKVAVEHLGASSYRNDSVWGKWTTDHAYRREAGLPALELCPSE